MCAAPAFASSYDFTLTDTTTADVYTFTLPSSPTVSSYSDLYSYFQIDNVAFSVDGVAHASGTFSVYSSLNMGGVDLSSAGVDLVDTGGAQIFVGGVDSPTFVTGSYKEHSLIDSDKYMVTIAATPEPSSIALLGTGLLSAAGVVRPESHDSRRASAARGRVCSALC